jgi:hypothetical protein
MSKLQAHSLVREGAPEPKTTNVREYIKSGHEPLGGCLIPRETGQLTVGRKITSTSVQLFHRAAQIEGLD